MRISRNLSHLITGSVRLIDWVLRWGANRVRVYEKVVGKQARRAKRWRRYIERRAVRPGAGRTKYVRVGREAWHPQGPPTSTQPPRATTFWGTTPPPDDRVMAVRAGPGARRHVASSPGERSSTGLGWGWMGPCGCQALGGPNSNCNLFNRVVTLSNAKVSNGSFIRQVHNISA